MGAKEYVVLCVCCVVCCLDAPIASTGEEGGANQAWHMGRSICLVFVEYIWCDNVFACRLGGGTSGHITSVIDYVDIGSGNDTDDIVNERDLYERGD